MSLNGFSEWGEWGKLSHCLVKLSWTLETKQQKCNQHTYVNFRMSAIKLHKQYYIQLSSVYHSCFGNVTFSDFSKRKWNLCFVKMLSDVSCVHYKKCKNAKVRPILTAFCSNDPMATILAKQATLEIHSLGWFTLAKQH